MKYTIVFLFAILTITACNNANNKQQAHEQIASTTVTENGSYYKRYSGNIAGQPVVLHLTKNGRIVSASYYYVSQGKPIGLYFFPDTTIVNGYTADEPNEHGDGEQPQWRVTIEQETIKGKWIGAGKKKTYDIDLKEEYPDGSYPLAVWEYRDSIPARTGKAGPNATVYYQLLHMPANCTDKDAAAFTEQTILKALGSDSMRVNSFDAYTKKQAEEYGKFYKETMADLPDSELDAGSNNYYTSAEMNVVMNENGWQVFEILNSEYTGGAHGNYGISYLNIDLQSKKLWHMEDILTVDSVKLQALLEAEGRKYYNMQATAKLSEYYLVDEILPNGNIYVTNKGIGFVYNPYEIASYAQGVISLFIPYDKIKTLLRPEFAKRMGL